VVSEESHLGVVWADGSISTDVSSLLLQRVDEATLPEHSFLPGDYVISREKADESALGDAKAVLSDGVHKEGSGVGIV